MNETPAQKPVIVTGLSGAGLSSALKSLEDLGFEVFDNFPLDLSSHLLAQNPDKNALAIGVDTRTRNFSTRTVIDAVRAMGAFLLFITCDDAILQKRFTETRRRHPLSHDKSVAHGIAIEHELLQPLMDQADLTIDTSELSIHDLRHILEGHFGHRKGGQLTLSLISFGYRHGLPREADIVMDVRFLKNPHWDKDLRAATGLEKGVGTYIKGDPQYDGFLENFKTLLSPLLPRYAQEGKHYLTIALGCTGGRHRSVFVAETLGKWLKSQNHPVHIVHRDIRK
jgi:RNase adapter protein RapZ